MGGDLDQGVAGEDLTHGWLRQVWTQRPVLLFPVSAHSFLPGDWRWELVSLFRGGLVLLPIGHLGLHQGDCLFVRVSPASTQEMDMEHSGGAGGRQGGEAGSQEWNQIADLVY